MIFMPRHAQRVVDGDAGRLSSAKDRLLRLQLKRQAQRESSSLEHLSAFQRICALAHASNASTASSSSSAASRQTVTRFASYFKKSKALSTLMDETKLRAAMDRLASVGVPVDVREAATAEFKSMTTSEGASHSHSHGDGDESIDAALASFLTVKGNGARAPSSATAIATVLAAYGSAGCTATDAVTPTANANVDQMARLTAVRRWRRRIARAVLNEANSGSSEWDGEMRRAASNRKVAAASAPPACSPFAKSWRELVAFSTKWRLARVARVRLERLRKAFTAEAQNAYRESDVTTEDPWISKVESFVNAELQFACTVCMTEGTKEAPRLLRSCADILLECRIARQTANDAMEAHRQLSEAHEACMRAAQSSISEKAPTPTSPKASYQVDWAALDAAVADATMAVREFLIARGTTDGLMLPATEASKAGSAEGAIVFFGAADRLRVFPGSVGGIPVTRLASKGVDLPEAVVGGDACVQLASVASAEGGYAVLTNGDDKEPDLKPLVELPTGFVEATDGDDARIVSAQTGRWETLVSNLSTVNASLESRADERDDAHSLSSDSDLSGERGRIVKACLLRALVSCSMEPAYEQMLADDEASLLGDDGQSSTSNKTANVDKAEAKRQALARQLEREEEERKEAERRKQEKKRQKEAEAAAKAYAKAEAERAKKEAAEAEERKAVAEAAAKAAAAEKKLAEQRDANDRAFAMARAKLAMQSQHGGAQPNGNASSGSRGSPSANDDKRSGNPKASSLAPSASGKVDRPRGGTDNGTNAPSSADEAWQKTSSRRGGKANGKTSATDESTAAAKSTKSSTPSPVPATATATATVTKKKDRSDRGSGQGTGKSAACTAEVVSKSGDSAQAAAAKSSPASSRARSGDDAPNAASSRGRGAVASAASSEVTPKQSKGEATVVKILQPPSSVPTVVAAPAPPKPMQRTPSVGTKLRTELDDARTSAAEAWASLESNKASGGAHQRVLLLEALSWDAHVSALAAEMESVALGTPGSGNDPKLVAAARAKAEELRGVAHAKHEAAMHAAKALSVVPTAQRRPAVPSQAAETAPVAAVPSASGEAGGLVFGTFGAMDMATLGHGGVTP